MNTQSVMGGRAATKTRHALAASMLMLDGIRLRLLLKRNPNWHLQPRVPAGQSDGGQWTDGGRILPAQAEGSGHRVDLRGEEVRGGHAIRDHVGRSRTSLLARVRGELYLGIFLTIGRYRDGSFPTVQAANKLVNSTLSRNHETVALVARGILTERTLVTSTFGARTGIEAFKRSPYSQPYLRDTYGVGVVILHDPESPRGFRVITAYPRND